MSRSLDGHRQSYVDLFQTLLNVDGPCKIETRWHQVILARNPVLFLMVEEHFGGYFLTCVLRALLGRPTAGLLFRGRQASLGSNLRLRFKRRALGILKCLPTVTTFSIVRFSSGEAMAAIADDWIDDPQMWDVANTSPPPTSLSQEVRALAGDRRVIAALGGQNAGKGFPFFADAWILQPEVRDAWLFVAAGKVATDCAAIGQTFAAAGGVLIDRHVSDEELLSLYSVSDAIWSCYAPDYDQASGIFGRAVQFNKPVVVRRGSSIEQQSDHVGAHAISIDYQDSRGLAERLCRLETLDPPQTGLAKAMQARTVGQILQALRKEPVP